MDSENGLQSLTAAFLFLCVALGKEMEKEKNILQLSDEEKKIIELLRSIYYGELRIIVNNSKPVRVEEIKKSIQL